MPKPDDEEKVVDETEDPTKDSVLDEDEEGQEETVGEAEAKEGGEAEGEEAKEGEEKAEDEESVASAEELSTQAQRIKDLEAENATLKGEPKKSEAPRVANATQAFLQHTAPAAKKKFVEARPVSLTAEGQLQFNAEGMAQQYDALYDTADHLVGAVMTDQISPVLDALASLTISLHNEVEIRDLRDSGGQVFKSMEKHVREELSNKSWKERRADGVVAKVYQRLLEFRGNGRPPAKSAAPGPHRAAAALRDASAGMGTKPHKASEAVKLTPEQEHDYLNMVEGGWTGSREQYHAKWKARAAKAKEAGRSIPKTYRQLGV